MHRLPELAVLWMVGVVAAGCAAPMSVSSHVAPGLDFSVFRTYAWGPADALPTGDPRLDQNPFFKDQLQGAVEKRLGARGLVLATSGTPDLLIHYHANITRRIDVNRLDASYGYCEVEGCGPPLIEYEAGTLVLDLIDARSGRLVWRGWAQNSVHDQLDDPDRMVRTIDDAVARMLRRLPRAL